MGHAFIGEMRKLFHPIVIVAALICVIYVLVGARMTYQYARLQVPVAIAASNQIASEAQPCRNLNASELTAQCQTKINNVKLNSNFATNAVRLGRVTNALSTWPAMLRFSSIHLATGLGWLLLGILFAVHVAGEWSSRTATATFLAFRQFPRFWLAKVGSLWVAMVAITLLCTTILWAARSAFIGSVGVPDPLVQSGDVSTWHTVALTPDPEWSSWSGSLSVLGRTAIIWLVFIAVGVPIAALIRRTLATFAAWVCGLSAVIVLAIYEHATSWTPIGVIGRVLNLNHVPFGVYATPLWEVPGAPATIQGTAQPIPVGSVQVIAWIIVPLLVALVAAGIAQRRRVIA